MELFHILLFDYSIGSDSENAYSSGNFFSDNDDIPPALNYSENLAVTNYTTVLRYKVLRARAL